MINGVNKVSRMGTEGEKEGVASRSRYNGTEKMRALHRLFSTNDSLVIPLALASRCRHTPVPRRAIALIACRLGGGRRRASGREAG